MVEFDHVLVVGAGQMGAGIAQVVAASGRRVFLYDAAPGAAEQGLQAMRRSLTKLAEKGGPDPEQVLLQIEPVDDLVPAALMVEAVVESADLLKQVMPFLDSITRDHKTIFTLCERIGNVEQAADESFDAGLSRIRAELGSGALNAIGYIDRKELYELIERVVDKCDDVANVVQTVTAKHV